MTADVSSVARMLRGYGAAAAEGKKASSAVAVVTRDLLGGSGSRAGAGDEVVDLEVKVPVGWERRLDLMSGKTYLTPHHHHNHHLHDLNLPPPATAATATSTFSGDLTLLLTTPQLRPPPATAAVCTLDKVRSALERATAGAAAGRQTSPASSSSTSTTSSSSGKRHRSPVQLPEAAAMRAAACPACLTYVLIAEANPRCPRCTANVPPLAANSGDVGGGGLCGGKKPRIDLNAAAEETE